MIFDIQIFVFRGHLCKNCSEFEKVKRKDATYANLTDRRHVKSLKLKSQITRIKKKSFFYICLNRCGLIRFGQIFQNFILVLNMYIFDN